MFRKTLFRLTILNTVIFIVCIGIFGASVYLYTRHVMYDSIDHVLKGEAQNVNDHSRIEPVRMPGMFVVLWNSDGTQMIGPMKEAHRLGLPLQKLPPHAINKIEQRHVGENVFRMISIRTDSNQGPVIVEFITLVTSQVKTLQTLLVIMLTGWGLAILLAVFVGYFLASRALKPIEQSWDKQRDFVSDASHELRTPLSVIQSRIERLLETPKAMIQDKVEDISVTLRETRRLARMVTNLLTLARSDSNQLEIKQERVLLNDLVKQVTDYFAEAADFQGKSIELEMGHSPVMIIGDQEKLHQLLVILLDNAMKFTTENGSIHVKCEAKNHSALLEIADNGIGIRQEDLPHIFDRFFQVDSARTDREGTGLGLSIASWISDKHKGKIEVKSEIGKGSRFIVSFPAVSP